MKRITWCVVMLATVALGRCDGVVAQEPEPPASVESPAEPLPVERTVVTRYPRHVLRVGQDYVLTASDTIRELAVILGDATIDGRVERDVVVVFGTARLSHTASIGGTLVVVGGTVTATPGAVLERDLIVVGGDVDAPPDFTAAGQHVVIGPALIGGRLDAVVPWITRGLLWGRLIVPDVTWVWSVVGIFFLVYLALNLVFDQPVRACAVTLAERPLTAFVVGLLVLLLAGPVCLLLAVSVVGIAVVPVVIGGVIAAGIIGRVGVARWIGMRAVPQEAMENRLQALRSFVIGFAVITLAYMVPVLGFLTWTMISVLGLGAASLAFIAGYRREHPAPAKSFAAPPGSGSHDPGRPPLPVYPAAGESGGATAPPPWAGPPLAEDGDPAVIRVDRPSPAAAPPPISDLTAYPRAAFLERLGAFVLDVILVLIAQQLFDLTRRDSAIFLLLLAYHIGFWTWKGTTVGGIICQLRLVRIDGAPLRFVDALVRGLSSIFSLVVLGLGALWILRDPERQAWHDKIAGTYVVRVPRHYPI